jgi:hypothetical protein
MFKKSRKAVIVKFMIIFLVCRYDVLLLEKLFMADRAAHDSTPVVVTASQWLVTSPFLAPGTTPEDLSQFFPLTAASGITISRKVFDLKWKILTNCAIRRNPASRCPHCPHQDSTEHWYLLCHVALSSMEAPHRISPDSRHYNAAQLLHSPPDLLGQEAALACEAYIWWLHLNVLFVPGVL